MADEQESAEIKMIACGSGCVAFQKTTTGETIGMAICPSKDITKREIFKIVNNNVEESDSKQCLQSLLDFGVPISRLARIIPVINDALRPISREESEVEAGVGFFAAKANAKLREIKETK